MLSILYIKPNSQTDEHVLCIGFVFVYDKLNTFCVYIWVYVRRKSLSVMTQLIAESVPRKKIPTKYVSTLFIHIINKRIICYSYEDNIILIVYLCCDEVTYIDKNDESFTECVRMTNGFSYKSWRILIGYHFYYFFF